MRREASNTASPSFHCVTIIGLSATLNLVLQTLFNPGPPVGTFFAAGPARPQYRARRIALLHRRIAKSVLVPVSGTGADLRDGTAGAVHHRALAFSRRLYHRTGLLSSAATCRIPQNRWVLPQIYPLGVWFSILTAIGVTSLYAFQVTEEARKLSDALAATELVLTREQHLTQIDGLAAAAAHELGTPLRPSS